MLKGLESGPNWFCAMFVPSRAVTETRPAWAAPIGMPEAMVAGAYWRAVLR